MRVTAFPLGVLATNSYVIDDQKSALCIDVGGDPAPIIEFLAKENLKLDGVIITHLHFDHLYGVHALQEKFPGLVVRVPLNDAPIADTESSRGGIWGMPLVPEFTSEPLPAKGPMAIGDFSFEILETPGHTPGGVSFYFKDAKCVFTGDALFYRSLGRTDFPGGDQDLLVASVRRNLFTLPPETVVYPGHGSSTEIGEEKENNPFIGDFVID